MNINIKQNKMTTTIKLNETTKTKLKRTSTYNVKHCEIYCKATLRHVAAVATIILLWEGATLSGVETYNGATVIYYRKLYSYTMYINWCGFILHALIICVSASNAIKRP